MSTAVLERVVEKPAVLEPAKLDFPAPVPVQRVAEKTWSDPNPLLPVLIAVAISAVVAGAFIGSVLIWIALRHTGIMAP
jgi:hypothetical protein